MASVPAAAAADRITRVAVFPVENLSTGGIPAESVRGSLIARLVAAKIAVLSDAALDQFMTRHRVRYLAGIDTATAESLRQELGVEGIVIASVGLASDTAPPKFALSVRLVSIESSPPVVVWADDAGVAGDDHPGFFELRMVNDYETLQARALDRLCDAMVRYLESGRSPAPHAASKFRPKSFYRGIGLESGAQYTLAVVPFFNLSDRRKAGDILALLFVRHLSTLPQFKVLDGGVARKELLDARIIMDGGLSITDAETVAALIDADFVLGGRVLRYDDYEGAGVPRVEFSTVLIDRRRRRVVWSSSSANDGSDGVHFFERGAARTAHAMATQMVRLTADTMARPGR